MTNDTNKCECIGVTDDRHLAEVLSFSACQTDRTGDEDKYDYIEAIASQLAQIANLMQNQFLRYLLNMVVQEANLQRNKTKIISEASLVKSR